MFAGRGSEIQSKIFLLGLSLRARANDGAVLVLSMTATRSDGGITEVLDKGTGPDRRGSVDTIKMLLLSPFSSTTHASSSL